MARGRALQLALAFLVITAPVSGATAVSLQSATAALPHEEVENSKENITVLRGPGELYESIDDPDDLSVARDRGRVRSPQFLVPGDLLALQFESEHVATDYAATDGANSTDRFFNLIESSETNFTVIGLNHGTEQLPSKLGLNRSNVKVLYKGETATLSLLIDTGNVSVVERDSGEPVSQTLGHREIQAILEVPTENETHVLTASSEFEGVGASLETPMNGTSIEGYGTPTISESAATELRIIGSTSSLPGTNMTVRARVSNSSMLVTRDIETYTANNSTAGFGTSEFNTTLPFPDADANDTVEIVVSKNGTVLTERTVLIGQQPKMYNTSARVETTGSHEGEAAITATLRLPEPGLLLIYVDGDAQTVTVPEHETVERTLYVTRDVVDESGQVYVLAMWDRNENGIHDEHTDVMYRTTADVGASAEDRELDTQVRVDGWPPYTATPTGTSREQTATPAEITSEGVETTRETSTPVPGFGMLITLISLGLVILLVQYSRRNFE